MGWALFFIGLMILIVLLCWIKITVYIHLMLNGWRPEMTLEIVALFRLLRIRWSYPSSQPRLSSRSRLPKKIPPQTTSPWTVHDRRMLFRIGRQFLRHVTVERWETETLLGTGQAHVTGWLTGWLWSCQGLVQAALQRTMRWQTHPRVTIRPDFQRSCFVGRLSCITSFRFGHAIIAGVRLLAYWWWTRRRFVRAKPPQERKLKQWNIPSKG